MTIQEVKERLEQKVRQNLDENAFYESALATLQTAQKIADEQIAIEKGKFDKEREELLARVTASEDKETLISHEKTVPIN